MNAYEVTVVSRVTNTYIVYADSKEEARQNWWKSEVESSDELCLDTQVAELPEDGEELPTY